MHAFGTIGRPPGWATSSISGWPRKEEGFGGDLGDYCFERQAAVAGKFATSRSRKINYAYHFDAGLYAAYLRRSASPKASSASRARSRASSSIRKPASSKRWCSSPANA